MLQRSDQRSDVDCQRQGRKRHVLDAFSEIFELEKHVEVVCNQKTLKEHCKTEKPCQDCMVHTAQAMLRTTSSGFKLSRVCGLILAGPNFNVRRYLFLCTCLSSVRGGY